MIYRIIKSGTKWQAQIKGAHNWIPLQDGNGHDMLHDTEDDARCEMTIRTAQFGELPTKQTPVSEWKLDSSERTENGASEIETSGVKMRLSTTG